MDSFKEAVVSAVAEPRGDAGLPMERALGTSKVPQLQSLAPQSSDTAEAEGQDRMPGKELKLLGLLFCASSALLVIM